MQKTLYIRAQASEQALSNVTIAYDAFLQGQAIADEEALTSELINFNQAAKFSAELNTVYLRRSPTHFLLQVEALKDDQSKRIVPVICYGSYDRVAVESGVLTKHVLAALKDFMSESAYQFQTESEGEIERVFKEIIWPWSTLIKKNILIAVLLLLVFLLVAIVSGIFLLA
ncbi:MAG: hypothetical protein Q4G44_01580 [Alcaligenaceae bacterium]|nr:hypothetical protein [Alcaligenaceae bacterium]